MGNKSIGKSSRRGAGAQRTRREEKAIIHDERLAQALVPEDEQPYAIPGNWVWVRLGDIINIKSGTSLPVENECETGEVIYLKVADMNMEENQFEIVSSSRFVDKFVPSQLIPSNSILFPKRGGAIFTNKKRITYTPILADLNIMAITPFVANFLFTYYWFLNIDLATLNNGSNVPQINNKDIEPLHFPLPPLAEQQRIVERIESLFEKLDCARELAQNALDSFETRKAAILHKAFTGELTRKWREENGVGMESWEEKRLDDCGQWFGGGTPNTNISDYWDDGTILWVTPKDMKAITIIDTIDKITQKAVNESSANLLKKSAVLFVMRSGILQRVLPIAMTTQQVTVNQDMKAVIPHNDILLEYLCWFCISREKDIREKCSKNGTTVESINTEMLYAYTVNIPTVTEQQEIVRIFDSLLEKDQHVRTLCGIIEKIDLMKKAILARAFRGELGTNDSGEESAMELGGGNDQFQRNIR